MQWRAPIEILMSIADYSAADDGRLTRQEVEHMPFNKCLRNDSDSGYENSQPLCFFGFIIFISNHIGITISNHVRLIIFVFECF